MLLYTSILYQYVTFRFDEFDIDIYYYWLELLYLVVVVAAAEDVGEF